MTTQKIEKITPNQAQKYLNNNLKSNRQVRKNHVTRLASAMDNGEWMFNGDPIRFAKKNGSGIEPLIDGQHRLHAVVAHGAPIEFLVIRGLQERVFQTIDVGQKRSLADLLKIQGEKHHTNLAAALRLLFVYSVSPLMVEPKFVSMARVLMLLEKHPDLRDSINLCYKAKYLVPGSILVFMHYVLSRNPDNRAIIGDFFLKLTQGVGMLTGDPVLVLRERLMAYKAKGVRIPRRNMLGLIFKTWNYTKYDERIHKLHYGETELFPLLAGVDYEDLFGYPIDDEILAARSAGNEVGK